MAHSTLSGRSLDLASNGETRGMVVTHVAPQGAKVGTEFGLRLAAILMRQASYLVTGGAGFIGSHLAEELLRRGHRVRVVDSLITGKRANLDAIPAAEFLEGDLADVPVAERAAAGMDY